MIDPIGRDFFRKRLKYGGDVCRGYVAFVSGSFIKVARIRDAFSFRRSSMP